MLIHECLTTCQLENVDDNMYVIVLPKSNPKVLSNFLSTYQPQGEDNYTLFKQFRNSIKDEQKIQITFNQDYAYKHKDVIFVNLYNPIIQAASLYFSQQESKQQKTFRFDLNLDKTDLSIRKGGYFLAIYQIEISKVVFGSNTISNILHPILFDIKNRCIIDDNDLATSFFGKAQILGEYQRQDGLENFDDELIVDMQLDMAEAIDLYRSSFANELQLKSDNAILSMKKQTESHYKYRINSMAAYIKETENRLTLASQINNEKEIRNAENTLRLQRYNLKTLEGEMEDEICRVSQSQNIEVRTTLLSINLINVK